VSFAWYFDIHFTMIDFLVIWALGVSMIVLAGLIYLPVAAIVTLSLIMVFGHDFFDGIHVTGNSAGAVVWSFLHQQNMFNYGDHTLFIGYPLIPWIGVMALGYCLGTKFTANYDPVKRKRFLIELGTITMGVFIVVRLSNVYGDPHPWTEQSTQLLTSLSFLNLSKYPPSLLYLLMTLGPVIFFLAFTEKIKSWFGTQIKMIGRVPMFYYLVHIYIIHLLAMGATYLSGHTWKDMVLTTWVSFSPSLNGYGFSLGVVYLVWAFVILILYFLCRWYDGYKRSHSYQWWLSYL
jgi:uncharacterized membrane protein